MPDEWDLVGYADDAAELVRMSDRTSSVHTVHGEMASQQIYD